MSTARTAVSPIEADTDEVEHIEYVVEWDMPEIPYNTIPCIERLLEYCDALEAVATGEINGMPEDARQSIVTLLSELRGYIVEVAAAEIDELCDRLH